MSSRDDDNSSGRGSDDGINHDINDDHGRGRGSDDGVNHDINDDHGGRRNDDRSSDDNSSGGINVSGNHKAFKFEIVNGQVTAVYEVKEGELKSKSLTDGGRKSYTVDGNDVIRTEIKPFGTEITRYSDDNGDGIYLRTSEQWQVSSNSNGVTPKFTDIIHFSHTSGDDRIAVRSGEDCRGGNGADDFVVREAAHLHIGDFSSREGDLLIFDTGLGLTSRDQLASYVTDTHHDGQNFIVNFGSDVSITLVGVQADQVSWNDVSVLS